MFYSRESKRSRRVDYYSWMRFVYTSYLYELVGKIDNVRVMTDRVECRVVSTTRTLHTAYVRVQKVQLDNEPRPVYNCYSSLLHLECSNRRHVDSRENQLEAMWFGTHRNLLINDCCNGASHSKLSADRRDIIGMTFKVGTETSNKSLSRSTIHNARTLNVLANKKKGFLEGLIVGWPIRGRLESR